MDLGRPSPLEAQRSRAGRRWPSARVDSVDFHVEINQRIETSRRLIDLKLSTYNL